jgi:DNA polymerase-3 subunit delta
MPQKIIAEIKKKNFKPVYLLHGEEEYYIDLIADAIIENALEEHERDFNMSVNYGLDADAGALIADAKSFPMMAERRLVVLREAQAMKNLADLESYLNQPSEQTIFVICHKHKALAANKKIYKLIAKHGVVFKSEKIKDYFVVDKIIVIAKELGYPISQKAAMLLGEHLGTDLAKIHAELNKLSILVEKGSTINEVHIEENIGISKDYNMFELANAVGKRDVVKAMQIVDYFEKNPKKGDLVPVVGSLFKLFQNLMRMHFTKEPDDVTARKIGMHPYGYKLLKPSMKIYPPKKISANISIIYEYDLKSKGVGNATFSPFDLMRELVYKLMH